jgi:hypothetical protein
MSERRERPEEREAVRTTIVGGRPPGSGRSTSAIPRGIEVLVKKASVDPAFRALLLETRAEAAGSIGLALDPAEAAMVAAVPREQLEAIIDATSVPAEQRRAFLGKVAAAMLAVVGVGAAGCGGGGGVTDGIRPDRPEAGTASSTSNAAGTSAAPASDGVETSKGIRPDRPSEPPEYQPTRNREMTRGIQPDRPR